MRVCLILEGCYPYVRGGVSTWAQEYIKSNPDIEFVIWAVHSARKNAKKPLYELPVNVVEMREVFLEDAYIGRKCRNIDEENCQKVVSALSTILDTNVDEWNKLFDVCCSNSLNSYQLGCSKSFFNFAVNVAETSNETIGLSDAYYGLKSMLMPLLFLFQQQIPEADLYHSAVTGYGGILGSLAKYLTGKPYILTEHGIYPREREEELLQADWVLPSLRSTWISMFYNLSKCAYYYADKVTALFESASQKQIEIGCDKNKCTIVENGIHSECFKDMPFRKSDNSVNIGAFLRFAPIKDIKTLIYAFFELTQKLDDVNLYLLGGTDDEEYKEECIALIKRLGLNNVIITGYVDTAEYMKNMDITVMSSISEGQPLAILESLSAGRPCVTTNVGNCKELLEEPKDGFGQAGFCCTPMDSIGLSDALYRLCIDEDLRKTFGSNGRKRIENNYTHKVMRDKYLRVYSEVL